MSCVGIVSLSSLVSSTVKSMTSSKSNGDVVSLRLIISGDSRGLC